MGGWFAITEDLNTRGGCHLCGYDGAVYVITSQ